MAEEDKELTLKEEEKRKKSLPWYQKMDKTLLVAGVVVVFLIVVNINNDPSNRNNYMLWIIGVIALVYFLGQQKRAPEEAVLPPHVAEFLVEKQLERKKEWGQFDRMCTFNVSPVSHLQKRDGGGMYYDISVKVNNPYDKPEFYTANVMARGLERGFVTFQESMGSITGREKIPERTIVPQWFKDLENNDLLEKMFFSK
jgi:hypothetical protein